MTKISRWFLVLVAFLQACQLYNLHRIQTAGMPFANEPASRSLARTSTKSRRSHIYDDSEEIFSACLMIMDDNAHLIEWLAYHYHVLPLRRLVVAVDPRSQTSPTEILQRWDGLIKITEWSDVDFMPPQLMDRHLHVPADHHEELTKLFRRRQEEFYTRCMARLKYEGATWTAFIDTDEYIVINANAQEKYKIPSSSNNIKDDNPAAPSAMTILKGIHKAQQESNFLANEISNSPCMAMARLAFGVKESTTEQVQRDVPIGFDGNEFQTMRWRWHAGRGMKKVNKISKSILDVSRISSELFVPTDQVMVHLPSKTHCHGGQEEHLWILNSYSPIVVHHYAGSWEQWSHRKDTRGKRTRENYSKLMYDKMTDDRIRPWLQEFVNEVGLFTAQALLHGVGNIPTVQMV